MSLDDFLIKPGCQIGHALFKNRANIFQRSVLDDLLM